MLKLNERTQRPENADFPSEKPGGGAWSAARTIIFVFCQSSSNRKSSQNGSFLQCYGPVFLGLAKMLLLFDVFKKEIHFITFISLCYHYLLLVDVRKHRYDVLKGSFD